MYVRQTNHQSNDQTCVKFMKLGLVTEVDLSDLEIPFESNTNEKKNTKE